ncbi:ABC transporter ATP-binding protein [Desulfosarcina sp. OttesenSCG-928-A07]|nr:ABC transporter ATP-binding protein [Desulfosarcina sp. OttesenSCG-928-G17]MDL2329346.1 ABC transporter ATP-binding protein [Desulfosarcina sp. OttesenSCG-928-A07]
MIPAIETTGLSVAYQKTPVLRDLSLTVKRGDFFVIIGPNGSGKTTLIKALAGLIPSAEKFVRIGGHPMTGYSKRKLARKIAYVAQSEGDDCPFTVRQVVLMGRSPYLGVLGMEGPTDFAIADQAMAFSGLSALSDRPVHRLSGGERQRAQIARAICQQPDLMLLDEPTAALDLFHQGRMMSLLAGLKAQTGTTLIMVSHDINLAAMYADQMLLLVKGQITAMGDVNTVVNPAVLSEAYGCPVHVEKSPCGPWPQVSLMQEDVAMADFRSFPKSGPSGGVPENNPHHRY